MSQDSAYVRLQAYYSEGRLAHAVILYKLSRNQSHRGGEVLDALTYHTAANLNLRGAAMNSEAIDDAMSGMLWLYSFLGSDEGGLLIWGLIARGLLIVASISLASLAWQARGLAGAHGQSPAAPQFRAYYRDFGIRALAYWPSLLWPLAILPAHVGDALLVALPSLASILALVGALTGGLTARVGVACSLATLLSIDTIHALVYPWDSLLFEALWLALAFPDVAPLWAAQGVAAAALPLPLVAFGVRLLSARLLLGFGLLKFGASGRGDHAYIKHFLIAQPMATPAGVFAHGLFPGWSFQWRAALFGSEASCSCS